MQEGERVRHTRLLAPRCAEFDPIGRSPDHRPKRVKRKSLQEQHEAFRARVVKAWGNKGEATKTDFCKRFQITSKTLAKFLSNEKTYHQHYLQAAKSYKPPQPVELVLEMKNQGKEFCSVCGEWRSGEEFRHGTNGTQYHLREFCK